MVQALAAVSLVLVAASAADARGQDVPTGLMTETVVTGLDGLVGIAFTADGRLFATEKGSGRILSCDLLGNVQVCGTVPDVTFQGERALGGIAVDPGWPERPYVYLHFTAADSMVHIARYTITGDVGAPASIDLRLGDRFEIIASVVDADWNHNGGTVRFGPDGMLYASFGDDNDPCSAQDDTDGRGKILRMDVRGLPSGAGGPPPIASLVAPGNPAPGSGGLGPLVFSSGLRNPFRFNVDAVTGRLYVADVGDSAWEEVNEVSAPGQDFGWPVLEGNDPYSDCPTGGSAFAAPIAAISHDEGFGAVISFGGRYRNVPGGVFNLGAAYEGDVFFHDFSAGEVRRLRWNGSAWVTPPPVPGQPGPAAWANGFAGVSDAVRGPDGAIYFADFFSGEIGRLRPVDSTADRISAVGGDGQAGRAGEALAEPLTARLTSRTGVPIAGAEMTFSLLQGAGTLGPQPVLTDAGGVATTTLQLSPDLAVDPVVGAHTPGAEPASFSATWRGLSTAYFAAAQTVAVNVRMATPLAPLFVALDVPVAQPYAVLPSGEIWTSVLDPRPSLIVVQGLFTDTRGVFAAAVPMIPSSLGLDVAVQAYGSDFGLLPEQSAEFVSNPATLSIEPNARTPQLTAEPPLVRAGAAGRPFPEPLSVQVTDERGSPLAGVPVWFSITAGSGTLEPQPRLTDAAGTASSNVTLSTADPTDLQVTATALGSDPATFDIAWRGLILEPAPGHLQARIQMADPEAIAYLTAEPMRVDTPFRISPWGPIWTSILEPQPTAGAIKGITGADRTWSVTLPNLPPGMTLTFQALGFDTRLSPSAGSILVSLPVTVTIQ